MAVVEIRDMSHGRTRVEFSKNSAFYPLTNELPPVYLFRSSEIRVRNVQAIGMRKFLREIFKSSPEVRVHKGVLWIYGYLDSKYIKAELEKVCPSAHSIRIEELE
jgi:hypothetical protein